jgi:ribonuclease D
VGHLHVAVHPIPTTVLLMSSDQKKSSRGRGRRSRRDRHHQDSHSESEPLSPIPTHENVPMEVATLIEQQDALSEVVDHLAAADIVTYDTEFIGEDTYYPQLCLVQVGTKDRVFLVDPFAVEDLCPLFDVLASPERTMLVHAGQQDLKIMARILGRPAHAVVDTQILGGLAGLPWPCSLTKSIQCAIDAPLPPGMTFTAWDARPLSKRQLRYAADDVRYLPVLHDFLMERIASRGHERWAEAACAVFDDPDYYSTDLSSQQRKIEGTRRFKPVERRILKQLVETRDAMAQLEDLPPRATVPDNVLLAITRDRPTSNDAIANLKGMPRSIAHRHGDRLRDAIEAGVNAEDAPQPRRLKEESPIDRVAVDGLWHAFSAAAIGAGVSPSLAISRAELAHWYLSDRACMPGKAPWQRDIVADLLEPLLSGECTLNLAWRENMLHNACETQRAKDCSQSP